MNYKSTEKELRNKYKDKFSNVLLCLLKQYYPAMTSSIVDQLNIDKSVFNECPVIYKDLGVPDDFNSDNPFEISPLFLQRYVDSIMMNYTSINDRFERRKYLHTVLKPMLIKDASPDFTDEDIEDKPVDPQDFYNRNKDKINDLLIKIYSNSSELETLKLSNEEIELVNFIHITYFGLSNTFYFSDLLEDIYNELIRIRKEKNIGFIEDAYYTFNNVLYSKIKNKQYPSNKIDNLERGYKIISTKLEQSYKKGNNKQKKESNMSLNKHLQIKLNISSREAQIIESVAKEYTNKKKQLRMEEVSFDDIKKGVNSGISKVKSMFGKDKKHSNEQDDNNYKKLRTNLFNSILQNQKILSELKEVGTFFNIFKDEHYSVTNREELGTLFRYNLNIPKNIIMYAIDYGKNYPKSLANSDNNYIFIDYVILSIAYATGNRNFEEKLYQYILNYYHVSKNKDVKEIENILFTNIYQNVFKDNLYRNVEREVKEEVENIKKYADSIDKYETRSDTPTEKSHKYQSDKNNNITGLRPSTLLKLYLHFYPNSNKFEFKDIFQYTMQGRWDKFISEKKQSKGNTMNLKNYLHKRLTISEKEATLIESSVRQYVQNSKRKK